MRSCWFIAALASVAGCDRPAIDPYDLKDVFTAPSASALARSAPLASVSASASASALPDASHETLPPLVRAPVAEACAELGGERTPPDARAAGRPACRRARVLEHRGAQGAPRYACLFAPDNLADRAPLPLVVFLHDEHDDATGVTKKTRMRALTNELDLTGEPRRRGFLLLAPQARRFQGRLRFETGYRARDNSDVASIDRFIDELVDERLVDARQIYTIGASRGGEMAALYAMMRPDRVAAFGVFGAAPKHLRWSCESAPPTPAMAIYRSCDSVTPCADVEQWLSLRDRERATTHPLRLGAGNSPEPSCATSSQRCSEKRGTIDHARWPKERERELLEYLGRFRLEQR